MPFPKQNYFQKRTKPKGPRYNNRISSPEVQVINQDGENVTVEINEEVNEGVKLIDMNQKEVVFLVEETDSYLIMNFKNEIKETSEY